MPITPYHFGPGLLFAAVAPRYLSWTIFALANVLIDLEPVSLYFLTGDPAHPWLHTLPGAVAVAVATALLGHRPCCAFLRWWNRQLSAQQARWLATHPAITATQAWCGAFAGTLSHLLLDGVMHGDVRPFWPLLATNPMQGAIGIDALELVCVIAGCIGGALLSVRAARVGL